MTFTVCKKAWKEINRLVACRIYTFCTSYNWCDVIHIINKFN